MSKPSCIRYSYTIQKVLKCTCNAYTYPHNLGYGDCTQSIIENPPVYHPPKRGLAAKIEKLLQIIEDTEDETVQEIIQDFRLSTLGVRALKK